MNVLKDISIQDLKNDLVVLEKGSDVDKGIHFDIPEGSSNKNLGISDADVIPGSSSTVSANTHPYVWYSISKNLAELNQGPGL